ncbi:ADP-ribosylglycohydrolase family protein, partial [Streptomyces sp. NPDC048253]|uniref:ADP-ribosylglycohydrolase family protein n=1 Tax=Streptomyces sp. NPDC048253 TaxID=3365524 RepID=UPI00371F8F6A
MRPTSPVSRRFPPRRRQRWSWGPSRRRPTRRPRQPHHLRPPPRPPRPHPTLHRHGERPRAAGNGSLMRASTSAVYFAAAGQEATMDAARRIAALTHGDRAAWEGTANFHELIRVTFEDIDPLAVLPDVLALVHPDHRGRYTAVLAPDWRPDQASEFNGAVWPCPGSAVWALRTTTSFEGAIRAAIDLGGDTDTVAAVTGGLAGAYYG